jgi:hypothetical protein
MEYQMSPTKLPVWAAVLFLSTATLAYGQATQAPAPGGTPPTTTTPNPPPESRNPGPDHPTPQGGTTPANPSH